MPGEEGTARARRGGASPGPPGKAKVGDGAGTRACLEGGRPWVARPLPALEADGRRPLSSGRTPGGPAESRRGFQNQRPPHPASLGGAPGSPPYSPGSWAAMHKCGPSLGTQGGLAAGPAGGGCLHSESAQMWGSHYTLVHEDRRPGLAGRRLCSLPPATGGPRRGQGGRCRQRPRNRTARGRGLGPG